jgi:uncharacterized protein
MKILIEIGHPGHVLHFKNFIYECRKKGHKIKVVSKDKEISLQLLQAFNIPYINLGKTKKGLFWKFIHTSRAILKTFMVSLRFKPDVYLGRASAELAFSSFILRKPYLCFSDTEHAKINRIVAHPFATKIITPSCFKINFGKKHLKVDSYFELAYLHPQYFKPDPSVFEDLDSGLKKGDEFFVLRFVSWGASHDIGQHGFNINNKRKLVEVLEKQGRVFITSEKPLEKEFEKYRINISPERIHDLLYYASMYVGEGGTMASEAAVLGTPSVFVNTLHMGYTDEEAKKYELIFQSTNIDEIIDKVNCWLENKNLKKDWQEKKNNLLKDKIDLTKWMVDFVEHKFD